MLSLPSSSSSISRQKYDVFLSFRGEDTRKNFADHLYAALNRSGILTFRDDQRLEAGEEIAPELLKAIQESWCSIIVFSETYAFSGWCLDELAEIVEQKNKRGHKIFPIFYDVHPSDFRKQTGRVEEAFAKHEKRYKEDIDKTKRWRTALTDVANIRGWHLSNRHESEFIREIVKKISAKLCQTYPVVLADGYPFKSLPSSFRLDNLDALHLPYSSIQQLWKESRPFDKLKFMDLKGYQNLTKTPDFTMTPNLESLILEGCTRIIDIHPSILLLRKLKLLNLKGCKSLRCLPTKKFGMESLEKLILSGCINIKKFPEVDGMGCLLELYLDGTRIDELPSSIGNLSNLVLLDLRDCSNLVSLPSSINGCKCLKTLSLSGCSKVETLPQNLQQLKFLEELDLSGTDIRKPPVFIFQFRNLKVLSFYGCKGPPSNLVFPFEVLQRGSTDPIPLMLPPLSGLSSLTELDLIDCSLSEEDIPNDICCLSSLKRLDLSANNFIYLPETINRLSKLRILILSDCKQLKSVPKLPMSIQKVWLDGCATLEALSNPSTKCNTLTKLKWKIKVLAKSMRLINLCIPGSEIPKWFSHQRDESSIKIPLPPSIRNDSQWMGVAFCCVFGSDLTDDDAFGEGEITCKPVIHGVNYREINQIHFLSGRKYRRARVLKDCLWVCYWSRDLLYPLSLVQKCGPTKNLLKTDLADQEWDEVFESSIVFESSTHCDGIHKVKCGVRIVYEKDLEETEETKEQCVNGRALIKRKQNIYEKEEAGPGESDTAEERLQPKWLRKFINFIKEKKH